MPIGLQYDGNTDQCEALPRSAFGRRLARCLPRCPRRPRLPTTPMHSANARKTTSLICNTYIDNNYASGS